MFEVGWVWNLFLLWSTEVLFVILQDCRCIIVGRVFSRRNIPSRLSTRDRSMQPGLTDIR